MHKLTRTLTVIGSAVALTFAGTGVASATSYPATGGIWDISSRLINPHYAAESELREAAVNYAIRSVDPGGDRTLDHLARDRAFPDTGFSGVWPATDGARWKREGSDPRFVFFKVETGNRGPAVDRLNDAWFTEWWQNSRDYGVDVTTSGDFHHVTVVFQS